ncbi:MAG: molybdopterin synthase catalytic subunit MoaE [Pseudomonadales bacterium]|nr:molybdopterin synthase catalytic subunit MoaE [Pseudomonadales bacterium]
MVDEARFDVAVETARLREASRQVGAITTFLGVVRDINEDASVSALFLEHYPGMTERQIHDILDEARARWDVIAATVIHRVGQLEPTDEIVYVGVASQHRGDAFDACEFIIDYLKTRATFWKKERTDDGERWLVTRESDVCAAESWKSGNR